MADRISALEAEKAALECGASVVNAKKATLGSKGAGTSSADDPGVAQLRLDLAESLRSKGVTENRLRAAEVESSRLRTQSKSDARSIEGLTADKASLTTRLKDREHELREKRKLLEV